MCSDWNETTRENHPARVAARAEVIARAAELGFPVPWTDPIYKTPLAGNFDSRVVGAYLWSIGRYLPSRSDSLDLCYNIVRDSVFSHHSSHGKQNDVAFRHWCVDTILAADSSAAPELYKQLHAACTSVYTPLASRKFVQN